MRIQHNITAMNSYRNFTINNSALGKNLEKLSSGYKVNRAGDDAAGLAISEKMRAQITGLEGATKNAKDGISLIQTAEGALTEVHSMLNRMTTLAEQSANGTYDNDVDRAQLQKEIESLKEEIDRIADSSNFNGLKLLDGSLSKAGATTSAVTDIDVSKMGIDFTANATDIAAVKGVYTLEDFDLANFGTVADGDKLSFTIDYTDENGKLQSKTVNLRFGSDSDGNVNKIYLDDGSEEGIELASPITTGAPAQGDLEAAIAEALNKDDTIKQQFKITAGSGKIEFQARQGGSAGAVVETVRFTSDTAANGAKAEKVSLETTTEPEDATKAYDMKEAKVWDGGKASDLEDAIFEINGQKFVFLASTLGTLTDEQKQKLADAGVGNNYVVSAGTDGSGITFANVKEMANKIAAATGLKAEAGQVKASTGLWDNTAGTLLRLSLPESTTTKGGGGLVLQIGDTADSYNKMTVSIADMHTKALGIAKIDIGTQDGASEAMKMIKDAINQVSDTRGGLGALQNRLDHTINNLGVMRENIQNAESTIRDTDVAEEMMASTKNSILNQSAQAMLAQANQLPQGVLQLLG